MTSKPAHFEQDIKVLLRIEPSSLVQKLKSLVGLVDETFSILIELDYLTDKTIEHYRFLQKSVFPFFQTKSAG